jgi:hypothetical protein
MLMLPKSFCAPDIYITTDTVESLALNSKLSVLRKQVEIMDNVSPKNTSSSFPFTYGLILVEIFFWPLLQTTSK